MLKKFTQLNTQDIDQNKIQSNISLVTDQIVRNPILDFNIVKNITLASGSNTVNHLLNRSPQGWFLTRNRSSATVYDTQDSNVTPQLNYILVSSASTVVDIYFF